MSTQTDEVSKFLSFVLRHKPEAIGLVLEVEGWADIASLIQCAIQSGRSLDNEVIRKVVESSDKKRFLISEDGLRIRAQHGHSTQNVSVTHDEKIPPPILFHGTATRFLSSILEQGLKPCNRHYVHLSEDEQTAIQVGRRHGKPVLLTVNASKMHRMGAKFYQAGNQLWLTEHVGPEFLTRI